MNGLTGHSFQQPCPKSKSYRIIAWVPIRSLQGRVQIGATPLAYNLYASKAADGIEGLAWRIRGMMMMNDTLNRCTLASLTHTGGILSPMKRLHVHSPSLSAMENVSNGLFLPSQRCYMNKLHDVFVHKLRDREYAYVTWLDRVDFSPFKFHESGNTG